MVEDGNSIEERIKRDPHIVSVLPAEDWKLPPLDLLCLEGREREAISVFQKVGKNFLECKYIIDDFEEDHSARRTWRERYQTTAEGHKYMSDNVLRINVITRVSWIVLPIEEISNRENKEDTKVKAAEISAYISSKIKDYNTLSTENKVEFVKELKRKVYALYCSLAQK